MSTETTRDLTREEIERVISDIIGAEDVRIIRHGIGSGDPSEVYGWVYDSEDEHPYRSETPDTLFDPEAEGWVHKPTALNLREWCSPSGAWLYIEHADGDITLGSTSNTDIVAHYTSRHRPTTALVHEIIRQNGGDSE